MPDDRVVLSLVKAFNLDGHSVRVRVVLVIDLPPLYWNNQLLWLVCAWPILGWIRVQFPILLRPLVTFAQLCLSLIDFGIFLRQKTHKYIYVCIFQLLLGQLLDLHPELVLPRIVAPVEVEAALLLFQVVKKLLAHVDCGFF